MAGSVTKFKIQTFQPWIALLFAVVLSFALMATDNTAANRVARQHAFDVIAFVAKPFGVIPAALHLASENERLRYDNAQLRLAAIAAEEAISENERLRGMLEFSEKSGFDLVAAEVLARQPMPGVNSILIDKGSHDGIRDEMAVITDHGLVGKIVQVGDQSSVVQVLVDRNLGAAVILSKSRANGVTYWEGGYKLFLENIPSTAKVRLGEKVITSGMDGIFPAGIAVGEVTQVEKIENSLFLHVEIEPAVDFTRLEEVFLVLDSPAEDSIP